MKKFINIIPALLALLVILLFIGCREVPPTIDFNPKVNYKTSISSTIPVAEKTKIFIEDITGVKCLQCPKAADKIKVIISANPDQVVAIGVYTFALIPLTSPWVNFDTLNTEDADYIYSNIYESPVAIPTGGVNRSVFKGETSVNVSNTKWSGYADSIKIKQSPVIISSKIIKYDSISHKVIFHVDISFAKFYTDELNLSIYLTESKIISKQAMPDGTTKDDYEHNHVLRKTITSFPLKISKDKTGNYEAGRIFDIDDFEVQLNPKWKPENCSFAIIVNRFDTKSKEVVQAAGLDLQ